MLRRWVVNLALCATLAYLAYQVAHPPAGWFSVPSDDYIQYWAAGRMLLQGANPYDRERLLGLEKEAGLSHELQQEAGLEPNQPFIMWNPPWSLSLVVPFGVLDYPGSRLSWFVFQLTLTLICSDWLWRLYGGPRNSRWAAWLIALTYYPTFANLVEGQITALLLLGVVGFLHFERRGQGCLAGAFAALLAVKPHLFYLFWVALALWVLDAMVRRMCRVFETHRGTGSNGSESVRLEDSTHPTNSTHHLRRRHVVWGGLLAGMTALFIPLARDPGLLQHYVYAFQHYRTPYQALSPTLGSVLRLVYGSDPFLIHILPSIVGVLWLAFYWFVRRRHWRWTDELPLILFVCFLTSPYGAWTCDRVVLLVPILQTAVWVLQSSKPGLKWIILATYVLIDALAPFVVYLGSTGVLAGLSSLTMIEFTLGYMTPALFMLYLFARVQRKS